MIWNMTSIWLILLIVFIVIELVTMGLATVWFACGAVGGLVISILGLPLWLQITVFVVVSVIMLLFTRPFAVKFFNRERVLTNAEGLIGRDVIVISEIDNLHGIGQVTVDGQEWSARTVNNKEKLPIGSVAKVMEIQGVKLIVKGKM